MADDGASQSWGSILGAALFVFAVAAAGCAIAFFLWWQSLAAPQVVFLGAGDRLSLLVTDGPARLLLVSGDDPVAYENALARVRPLYARRIDVLLVAGSDRSLLAPIAAREDPHLRTALALGLLPRSPEAAAIGPLPVLASPRRIRLGPAVSVTVETALPYGADPSTTPPSWRAIIEHGGSRIVVFSDGEAASLFPWDRPAAVVAVAGNDPGLAAALAPAVALVANGEVVAGPEFQAAAGAARKPPAWTVRVFAGEALRLRFVPGGVEFPSETALAVAATPAAAAITATIDP